MSDRQSFGYKRYLNRDEEDAYIPKRTKIRHNQIRRIQEAENKNLVSIMIEIVILIIPFYIFQFLMISK